MKLFELLDEMAEERSVEIEWHYHEEDDTMEEFGEEFAEDMENASFQLKAITMVDLLSSEGCH